MADWNAEVYAALRASGLDVLRQLGLRDADGVAQALARHQYKAVADAVATRFEPDVPEISHVSLDWAVSQRVNEDVAAMVRTVRRQWHVNGLTAKWGTLQACVRSLPDAVREAWLLAQAALAENPRILAERLPLWLPLLLDTDATLLSEPPIAVEQSGGARLLQWSSLDRVAATVGVLPDWQGSKAARLVASLDAMIGLMRLVASLQWRIADYVGRYLGMDRAGFAWHPHVADHMDGAADRYEQWTKTQRLDVQSHETLVAAPETGLRLACQALRFITDGERFQVPAVQSVRYLTNGKVRSVHVVANHALVSADYLGQAISQGLRAMGKGHKQALTASHDVFLQAVRQARGNSKVSAPRGFWKRFAETWNQGREQPETENALQVRYHRLMKKVGSG